MVTLTKHLKETIDLFGLMVSEGSALRGKEGVGVAEYHGRRETEREGGRETERERENIPQIYSQVPQ